MLVKAAVTRSVGSSVAEESRPSRLCISLRTIPFRVRARRRSRVPLNSTNSFPVQPSTEYLCLLTDTKYDVDSYNEVRLPKNIPKQISDIHSLCVAHPYDPTCRQGTEAAQQ
jgi:hypothetical protein